MAYVLGLFAADGNMIKNKRGAHFIALYSNDRGLLVHVRNVIGSSHKIAVHHKAGNRATAYQIQIGSKEWFNDLSLLGMTPNKSKSLQMPRVPPRFIADFVRGYFDGDGCVYFARLKFTARKRPRNILNTLFTCGSADFLREPHTVLKLHGIKGGCIRTKKGGYDLSLSFRDSLALYRLMYNTGLDTGLYLPRKYTLFRKAIRTLYPNLRE